MTTQVKRNHFYKKQTPTVGINLELNYPDLASSSNPSFELTAGVTPKCYVLSGTVSDNPSYGSGELVGGLVGLYLTSTNMENNRATPEIFSYRMKPETTLTEGNFSLAHISGNTTLAECGHNLAVYQSSPVSDIDYLYEDFEGSPEEFEGVQRMGASAIVTYKKPYMLPEDYFAGLEEMGIGPLLSFSKKIFQDSVEDARAGLGKESFKSWLDRGWTQPWQMESSEKYLKIKLLDNGHKWRFQRRGKTTSPVLFEGSTFGIPHGRLAPVEYTTGGKWAKKIRYLEAETTTADIESAPTATEGNTVFSDVYATRNFSNYYDGGPESPVLNTIVELSTENFLTGGQGLRLYHNWGASSGSAVRMLNESIPKVQNAINISGNLNPQCARLSLYDIPFQNYAHDVGMTTLSANDDTPVFGNVRTVLPEIQIPMNISKMGPNVLLNIEGPESVSAIYDTVRSFFYNWSSGNTDNYSKYEHTFLRSVVVTFSNYKPKPSHTTVDKFIAYGLNNFYTTIKNRDHIVGGVVFTRLGMNPGEDAANCYAFPLPVTAAMQCTTATHGASQTLISGGIGQVVGKAGLSNCDTLIWGKPPVIDPNADNELRFVQLPMNSWFNMRCFFDPWQPNNTGSIVNKPFAPDTAANPSLGTVADRGVSMRILFDAGADEGESSLVNSTTEDIPFLDIPFPCGGSMGTETYNFGDPSNNGQQSWWPKHMTIWVQNYPWVSGSTTSQTSACYVGDDSYEPVATAREVEVFLDSIRIKGVGPKVGNNHPSISTSNIVFNPENNFSPISTMVSGAAGAPEYFHRSWVGTHQLNITDDIAMVSLTAGETTATLLNSGDISTLGSMLSTYNLQNCGTVTAYGTELGPLKVGHDVIASFSQDDYVTFELTTAYSGSTGNYELSFLSTGTLEPPVNRAEMYEYDTGTNIAIGFDNKSDLPISSDRAANASGYLLWNDFNTLNWTDMAANPLTPTKVKGFTVTGGTYSSDGASTNEDYLGSGLHGGPTSYISGNIGDEASNCLKEQAYRVDNGGTLSTNGINLGSGSNNFFGMDGFRQKGFSYISLDSTTYTRWKKRENILTSTKIRRIGNMNNSGYTISRETGDAVDLKTNQIRVMNPSIFNPSNKGEQYIIYQMGTLMTSATYKIVSLASEMPITDDIITFTSNITFAQDGETLITSEEKLSSLWISPYKFWVNMFFNTAGDTISRNYASVCTINETPDETSNPSYISGSTFNEYTYSYDVDSVADGGESGLYKRPWDLVPSEDNSTLVLGEEYGYDPTDPNPDTSGYLFTGAANLNSFNHYNISQAIRGLKAGDNFPFIVGSLVANPLASSLTFPSDDFAGDAVQKPCIYWEFRDDPPELTNFTVGPAFDTLEKDVDLYALTSENLNALKFTWSESQADDIWYRMLMVDRDPIVNKYHNCTMWVPLNEATPDYDSMTAGFYTVHNPAAGTSGSCTVGTNVRAILEGQGGYAAKITGSATSTDSYILVPSGTNTGLDGLTEFTLVAHVTFASGDKGVEKVVLSQSDAALVPAANDFVMKKSTSDTIRVGVGADITLESNTAVPCDTDKPVSIIVTLHSGSQNNIKARLFIDGTEQDNSTGSTFVSNSNDFVIGGYDATYNSTTSGLQGFVEEILIYNKAYEIVENSEEYIYPNTNNIEFLSDDSSAAGISNYTYNARLFAADYHNFRGASRASLGMSQQISWRPTTL